MGQLYGCAILAGLWLAILPLRAARWVYGPYGFEKEFMFNAGWFGLPAQPAGAILDRLLTVRALIALGVLTLVLQTVLDPMTGLRRLASIGSWLDGLILLVIAPVGVVLLTPILILIARQGHKASTAKAALRPLLTGLFSALLLATLIFLGASGAMDTIFDTNTITTLAGALAMLMLVLFLIGAAYLVQRNGLCGRKTSDLTWLIAPVLSVWSAWWLAVIKLTMSAEELGLAPLANFARGLDRWQDTLAILATPVAVSVVAAMEIRTLRGTGLSFRTRRVMMWHGDVADRRS